MDLLHCSALHLSRFLVLVYPSLRVFSTLVVSTLLVVSPLCSPCRPAPLVVIAAFVPLCIVFAVLLLPPRLPPLHLPPCFPLPPCPRYYHLPRHRCCFHCHPPHLYPPPPTSFPSSSVSFVPSSSFPPPRNFRSALSSCPHPSSLLL